MDSGTMIVAAVFIAICILPFILTGRKYRKQKGNLIKALNFLAGQQNFRIKALDVSGNFGIGMDENSKSVLFARAILGKITTQQVDLAEYNRCKLNNVTRVFDEGEKVTERIELVFFAVSAENPPLVLDLYNSETDSLTLSGELQVAEKWALLIGKVLHKSKSKATKYSSGKKVAVA